MRGEYDFSKGVRGKYAARYAAGTNVVVLEPDIAELFPSSEAVNRALRAIADVAPVRLSKSAGKTRSKKKPAQRTPLSRKVRASRGSR